METKCPECGTELKMTGNAVPQRSCASVVEKLRAGEPTDDEPTVVVEHIDFMHRLKVNGYGVATWQDGDRVPGDDARAYAEEVARVLRIALKRGIPEVP